MKASPLPPVELRGAAAFASSVIWWRHGGVVQGTLVARATFALRDGSSVAPTPLTTLDRVPFRPRCDVHFIGAGSLWIARGGETLLEATFSGQSAPTTIETSPLDDGSFLIHDGTAFERFQTAPPHHQIERLRGDEQIAFSGRVLPLPTWPLRAFRMTNDWSEAHDELDLVADTLTFDVHTGLCSVVWRGPVLVSGAHDLTAFRTQLCLHVGVLESASSEAEMAAMGTVGIAPEDRGPALPFASSESLAQPTGDRSRGAPATPWCSTTGTVSLPQGSQEMLRQAVPFPRRPPVAKPGVEDAPPRSAPGAPWSRSRPRPVAPPVGGGTIDLVRSVESPPAPTAARVAAAPKTDEAPRVLPALSGAKAGKPRFHRGPARPGDALGEAMRRAGARKEDIAAAQAALNPPKPPPLDEPTPGKVR